MLWLKLLRGIIQRVTAALSRNSGTKSVCVINPLMVAFTVNSSYLDFDYLELPLISKRKSGPCFNTEI